MALYETIEIAKPGGEFAAISAITVGPFAVHSDGGIAWIAPGTDDEEGDEEDTYNLTHINTGYALITGRSNESGLIEAARRLAADPEIFAFFDQNDDAQAMTATITPEMKQRLVAIIKGALKETPR